MSVASLLGTSWLRAGSSFVVLFALLCSGVLRAAAQQQVLTVSAPGGLPDRVQLRTFRGGTKWVSARPDELQKQSARFVLKRSRPFYTELWGDGLSGPLPLFLEGEDVAVAVTLNCSDPEASAVRGSRMNSQFRYALERVREDIDELDRLIAANPEAIYDAALILDRLPELELDRARELASTLQGPAKEGYHYALLSEQLDRLAATQVGSRLPDFVFADSVGALRHVDSMMRDGCATLLLIGASWCDQCARAERALRGFCSNHPDTQLIYIEMDRHPEGWDAPFMRALAVDHIPFLLHLDDKGVVSKRDARVWSFRDE